MKDFAEPRRAQADRLRARRHSRRTSRPTGSSSAPSTASSTASSSRAPTSRPSGTTSTSFKDAGVEAAEDVGRPAQGREDDQRVRHAGLLDRRRRRLDPHRPLREHLPAAGRAGQVRPADDAQDPVDRSVGERGANEMAQVLGDTTNIAGGTSGALQTDFPTSVTNVFADPPKAAMVFEGDFVAGVVTRRPRRSRRPTTTSSRSRRSTARRPVVVGGGDIVVMFKDNPAARALVEYLATPEAAEIWAKQRRLLVAEQERRPERLSGRDHARRPRRRSRRPRRSASTCPTCSRRRSAADARRVHRPAGLPQEPVDVDGHAAKLEKAAAAAYKKLGRRARRRAARRRGGAPRRGGSARAPRAVAGVARGCRWRSSAPALFLLGVWIIYPTIATILRSFFDDRGN